MHKPTKESIDGHNIVKNAPGFPLHDPPNNIALQMRRSRKRSSAEPPCCIHEKLLLPLLPGNKSDKRGNLTLTSFRERGVFLRPRKTKVKHRIELLLSSPKSTLSSSLVIEAMEEVIKSEVDLPSFTKSIIHQQRSIVKPMFD
jgi:hypothetical protein